MENEDSFYVFSDDLKSQNMYQDVYHTWTVILESFDSFINIFQKYIFLCSRCIMFL